MAGNKGLHAAKTGKNDEFYTQLSDIEAELKHYKKHFAGKTVFCNCDDPYESNFFKYFATNFNTLGLKKLIATCYQGSAVADTQLSLDFYGDKPKETRTGVPHKIVITEVKDYNGDGAVNIYDVEYLIRNDKNVLTRLEGTGDFRSEECLALLREADIVVTNPPFSLFREYVKQLIDNEKKFLIVGNKNAITYKETFSIIKDNKLWCGVRGFSGGMWFNATYEGKTEKVINGKKLINVPSIWFTNLDHSKRHEELDLYKKYTPEEYPKYDNYDAINVNKTADIPRDYEGVMDVPITFLDKYNPEQFEIKGIDRYIEDNPNYGHRFKINGKEIYARILIRRK